MKKFRRNIVKNNKEQYIYFKGLVILRKIKNLEKLYVVRKYEKMLNLINFLYFL